MIGIPSPEQTADYAPLDNNPGQVAAQFDNNKQAVDIKGYRVLSQDEKDRMNQLKDMERHVLEQLKDHGACVPNINLRSLSIAKTELQTGFMWAIRAIARPNGE